MLRPPLSSGFKYAYVEKLGNILQNTIQVVFLYIHHEEWILIVNLVLAKNKTKL